MTINNLGFITKRNYKPMYYFNREKEHMFYAFTNIFDTRITQCYQMSISEAKKIKDRNDFQYLLFKAGA